MIESKEVFRNMNENLQCSFCHRWTGETRHMVVGDTACICNICMMRSMKLIADKEILLEKNSKKDLDLLNENKKLEN